MMPTSYDVDVENDDIVLDDYCVIPRSNLWYRKHIGRRRLRKLYDVTKRYYGAGVYFDRYKNRLVRYTCNSKSVRRMLNRIFRRRVNRNLDYAVANDGGYRKHTEYWWSIL